MGFTGGPLALYEIIRKINPVPFGAFLNYGDFQIMSNSPERLLKIHNGIAETSPIKGTRPRGRGRKEDRNLIKELKTNAKELSEHIMIVDLERNDLGRFCDPGSIKVNPLQKIYTYPTLHHMVSTVKGKVRDGMETADCIKALFPGGSVTGAPKIRAKSLYLTGALFTAMVSLKHCTLTMERYLPLICISPVYLKALKPLLYQSGSRKIISYLALKNS